MKHKQKNKFFKLSSNTVGFCVCGEKTCFKECKVCDILLNDKLNLDTQAIIISIIFMRYITKR